MHRSKTNVCFTVIGQQKWCKHSVCHSCKAAPKYLIRQINYAANKSGTRKPTILYITFSFESFQGNATDLQNGYIYVLINFSVVHLKTYLWCQSPGIQTISANRIRDSCCLDITCLTYTTLGQIRQSWLKPENQMRI